MSRQSSSDYPPATARWMRRMEHRERRVAAETGMPALLISAMVGLGLALLAAVLSQGGNGH